MNRSTARPATQALKDYIHSFEKQNHATLHHNEFDTETLQSRKRKNNISLNVPVSKSFLMENWNSDSDDDAAQYNNSITADQKIKPRHNSVPPKTKHSDNLDSDDSSSNDELLPSKFKGKAMPEHSKPLPDPALGNPDFLPSENSNRKSLLLSLSKEITSQLESEDDKPKVKRRKLQTPSPSSSDDESIYNRYAIPVMSSLPRQRTKHRIPKYQPLPTTWDSDSDSNEEMLASVVNQNLNVSSLSKSRLQPDTIKVEKPSKIVIYNSYYSDKDNQGQERSTREPHQDTLNSSVRVTAQAPTMSTSSTQTNTEEPPRVVQQPQVQPTKSQPELPQQPSLQPDYSKYPMHPLNYPSASYVPPVWQSQGFPNQYQHIPVTPMFPSQPTQHHIPVRPPSPVLPPHNVWDTYLRSSSYPGTIPSAPFNIPPQSVQYVPNASFQRTTTPQRSTSTSTQAGRTTPKQFKVSLLPPVSVDPPASSRPPLKPPVKQPPSQISQSLNVLQSYDELSSAVKNITDTLNTIKTNIQIKQQHYKMGLCSEEQYIKYLKAQSLEYQKVKAAQGHKIAEYTNLISKQQS